MPCFPGSLELVNTVSALDSFISSVATQLFAPINSIFFYIILILHDGVKENLSGMP